MLVLRDAENPMIVSLIVWTKHRNVTEGQTDGQADRRTDRRTDKHTESLYLVQRSACQQYGSAVKTVTGRYTLLFST